MNPGYNAANVEEFGRATEERFVIRVNSEPFVAEKLAKVKEITRATAKIENLERRRAIEPKVLESLDVYADPVGCVFVSVNSSRVGPIGILFAQSRQLCSIHRGENPSGTYRVCPTASVLPQAFRCVTGEELLKFLGKSHCKRMQRSASYSRNDGMEELGGL